MLIKKSVNLYFDVTQDAFSKLLQIKNEGYDEFFTCISKNVGNKTLVEQVNFAKNLGLNCTMIHCAYDTNILDNFWLDNSIGEEITNDYISQIEQCKGLTKNFVVHLQGTINSTTSTIGLDRIKKLLSVCEKNDINLCVENLCTEAEIPYIFSNISHKNLKICFDTGHKNFTTKNLEILRDFGQYVSVLHIHDNFGDSDAHLICGKGNIDWDKFAKEVAPYNLTLSAEIKITPNDNKNTYLSQNYNALCDLEKRINNYKK